MILSLSIVMPMLFVAFQNFTLASSEVGLLRFFKGTPGTIRLVPASYSFSSPIIITSSGFNVEGAPPLPVKLSSVMHAVSIPDESGELHNRCYVTYAVDPTSDLSNIVVDHYLFIPNKFIEPNYESYAHAGAWKIVQKGSNFIKAQLILKRDGLCGDNLKLMPSAQAYVLRTVFNFTRTGGFFVDGAKFSLMNVVLNGNYTGDENTLWTTNLSGISVRFGGDAKIGPYVGLVNFDGQGLVTSGGSTASVDRVAASGNERRGYYAMNRSIIHINNSSANSNNTDGVISDHGAQIFLQAASAFGNVERGFSALNGSELDCAACFSGKNGYAGYAAQNGSHLVSHRIPNSAYRNKAYMNGSSGFSATEGSLIDLSYSEAIENTRTIQGIIKKSDLLTDSKSRAALGIVVHILANNIEAGSNVDSTIPAQDFLKVTKIPLPIFISRNNIMGAYNCKYEEKCNYYPSNYAELKTDLELSKIKNESGTIINLAGIYSGNDSGIVLSNLDMGQVQIVGERPTPFKFSDNFTSTFIQSIAHRQASITLKIKDFKVTIPSWISPGQYIIIDERPIQTGGTPKDGIRGLWKIASVNSEGVLTLTFPYFGSIEKKETLIFKELKSSLLKTVIRTSCNSGFVIDNTYLGAIRNLVIEGDGSCLNRNNGILVKNRGGVELSMVGVTNFTGDGIKVSTGSSIMSFVDSHAVDLQIGLVVSAGNLLSGFVSESAGSIESKYAIAHGNLVNGFAARDRSSIYSSGAYSHGNGNDGFGAGENSVLSTSVGAISFENGRHGFSAQANSALFLQGRPDKNVGGEIISKSFAIGNVGRGLYLKTSIALGYGFTTEFNGLSSFIGSNYVRGPIYLNDN